MNLHTRKEPTLHPLTYWPGRLRRARMAALAGALAVTLIHAEPSHAVNAYVHQSCQTPADVVDAYGGWQPFGTVVAGNGNANQCAWGGLHSEMYPGSTIPLGSSVGWRYTAPAGTSIGGFSAQYAGWTKPAGAGFSGSIQVLDQNDTVGLDYTDSGAPASNPRTFAWGGLTTNTLRVRTLCNGLSGPGCLGSTAWSSFYSPKLWLVDDTPPSPGAVSGSATTDYTLTGSEQLSYAASDTGGGIARFRLYVDGVRTVDHVVDTFNGHCQIQGNEESYWVFSYPKPCPGAVDTSEAIDTTAIADGLHTITARIVDASQRDALLWSGSRLVGNHPPVNTQLPAFRDDATIANPLVGAEMVALSDGTWSGPNLNMSRSWVQCDGHGTVGSCAAIPGATALSYKPTADDVGHRLRLLVTATNVADSVAVYSQPTGIVTAPSSAEPITPKPEPGKDAPAPPAAAPVLPSVPVGTTVEHAFRGRIAGEPAGTACPQDRATLTFEHVRGGQLELAYGKAATAQVQLTCTTTGKAIEGAHLDIATRVGRKAAVAADVATDGAGHATLRLARGAGRAVTVGYRMYADDPIARATATLKVVVNGKVTLKADHRHLRNGQAVRLRGALAGGEVPTRGVTLAVQWKDRHRWRPFAQIKTNRKGTFTYAYKFTRTSGRITYALRVQVTKGQVDYPYLATASKAVKVTVAR
jgi:hypothetical protein